MSFVKVASSKQRQSHKLLGLFCGLVLTFFVAPLYAAESLLPPPCKSLLTSIEYNYTVDTSTETHFVTATSPVSGEKVANLEFKFNEADESIYVEIIGVDESFRGQGISKILFAEAFRRFPLAQNVDAELVMDNFKAFKDALMTSIDIEESLRQTPLYKVVATYGFTDVVLRDSANPKIYDRKKEINVTFSKPR